MKHFMAWELVCQHVYTKYGERSLMFADDRLLTWLSWFRDTIDTPVIVNTYISGGFLSQRGYRCNLCSLVAAKTKSNTMYLSAHTRFQAVDFNVRGMSDEEVRRWIEKHKEEMPVNIRVEKDIVGWVHVDVTNNTDQKIIYFQG